MCWQSPGLREGWWQGWRPGPGGRLKDLPLGSRGGGTPQGIGGSSSSQGGPRAVSSAVRTLHVLFCKPPAELPQGSALLRGARSLTCHPRIREFEAGQGDTVNPNLAEPQLFPCRMLSDRCRRAGVPLGAGVFWGTTSRSCRSKDSNRQGSDSGWWGRAGCRPVSLRSSGNGPCRKHPRARVPGRQRSCPT